MAAKKYPRCLCCTEVSVAVVEYQGKPMPVCLWHALIWTRGK